VKQLLQGGFDVRNAAVIVPGLTFKENCGDIRNSRVIDIVRELQTFGVTVHVHDPVAAPEDALREYGITLVPWDALPRAQGIVAAVPHREFGARPLDDVCAKLMPGGLYVDVKCHADAQALADRGMRVWRL
jgi:UDP-N-acetyl-D-galactosamine dehydrogenase